MEEASTLFEKFLRTFQKGEVIFEDGAAGAEPGDCRLLRWQ